MIQSNRQTSARAFIAAAGWAEADVAPLAGDASNRRYDRLHKPDGSTAVLMDAPPEKGEDVRPFVTIADHLAALNLSAPHILARDEDAGFLLLEDLGDALFARTIEANPTLERPLYEAAVDLLVQLHTHPAPAALPTYDPSVMADLAALPFDWYPDTVAGFADQRTTFVVTVQRLLATHAAKADVMIQRDYHAENLLWLPQREGIARVGLLDFQDARAGHRAYDLVSLLEDARRDVTPALQQAMLTRYIAASGADPEGFAAAYACLGAQRNLRILGVFSRLCIRDGKAHYVDLIPRVWGHLQHDLSHPALTELRDMVARFIPDPTPDRLQRIKTQCATLQTQ